MNIAKLFGYLFILFPLFSYAQVWDGGGDSTSWHDPFNWAGDTIPPQDAVVLLDAFEAPITITGHAPFAPASVNVSGTFLVTLAMDSLNVGNGVIVEHSINIDDNARLLILNGIYNIKAPINRNGINIFPATHSADLKIEDNAKVNILSGMVGISLGSPTSVITNNGTTTISNVVDGIRISDSLGIFLNNGPLTINTASSDGIDNAGYFQSFNTIDISGAGSNGINNKSTGVFVNGRFPITIDGGTATTDGISNEGQFINQADGTINVIHAADDGIETIGKVFQNDGTINITMRDGATSTQNGLSIGTGTKLGHFINTSNNSLNIYSLDLMTSRLINIAVNSVFDNSGFVSLQDSFISSNASIYSAGLVNNLLNGRIDLGSTGRITLAPLGHLVNRGLIVTQRGTQGVLKSDNSSIAENHGYYDYSFISNFSAGIGQEINKGIDLRNPAQTNIDAGDSCDLDIANVPYSFVYLGDTIGITNDTGAFHIPENSVNGDTVIFQNARFPEVKIFVTNYCLQALPVTFTDFSLLQMTEGVRLQWSTSEERNNSHFEAQKSRDGKTFHSFDRIEPNSAFDRNNDYFALDEAPFSGINYYRIKQVDIDGGVTYTDIKQVRFEGIVGVSLTPNFAQSGQPIQLLMSKDELDRYDLPMAFDALGRRLNIVAKTSENSYQINTLDLRPGLYFVSISPTDKALTFVINR